jgi:acyl-coenzyme A thioesterase PaaI-like protein
MSADQNSPPFYTRYGLSRSGDAGMSLVIEPYPEIVRGGVVLPTVLASAVDIVGSLFTRKIAGTDLTFTTDLSVRSPARFVPERILARGELLRAGRTMITTGVTLEARGEFFAYGETTFMRVARSGDPRTLAELGLPAVIPHHPLRRPLRDEVGVEVVDPSEGRVAVVLRPELLNLEGSMQGALVAHLAQTSAEVLAEHHHAKTQVVTDLDIRYLSTAKVGPIEASASWVGTPADGTLRIRLFDRGKEGQVTAAVLARTAAAPAPEG